MSSKDVGVVLVHGAWADGLSWARVLTSLQKDGVRVTAAPLPLTSLSDEWRHLATPWVGSMDRSPLSGMPMPAP